MAPKTMPCLWLMTQHPGSPGSLLQFEVLTLRPYAPHVLPRVLLCELLIQPFSLLV